MQHLLIKLLVALLIRILKRNLLVREQHEVINKDFSRLFQCVLRVNGTIGRNFNNQFVIVGLLFDTIWLNGIFHVTDRGVDGIDWKYVYISAELTVFLSRDIATPLVDGQINLHRSLGV